MGLAPWRVVLGAPAASSLSSTCWIPSSSSPRDAASRSCAVEPSHLGPLRAENILEGRRRSAVGAAIAGIAVAACFRRRAARAEESSSSSGAAQGGFSKAFDKLTIEDRSRIDALFQKAFNVPTVEEEEATWTELLDKYGAVPEVEARAVSNRGNSRARQGKLNEAVQDYSRSIELAPGEKDAYLNRGAIYEALGRLNDAMADYDKVLGLDQGDPAAWNNRGNALLGLGRYEEARDAFKSALSISGAQNFAFAAVNLNLAEFELGNDEVVQKNLRAILLRNADAFPDARAVYALVLWDKGDRVAAEEEWDRATAADPRYRALDWVTQFRRWPPRLRGVLQRFSESTKVKVK